MLVIVSDNSVHINLEKTRLIESALALPFEFVMRDVMYADELLDLGKLYTWRPVGGRVT